MIEHLSVVNVIGALTIHIFLLNWKTFWKVSHEINHSVYYKFWLVWFAGSKIMVSPWWKAPYKNKLWLFWYSSWNLYFMLDIQILPHFSNLMTHNISLVSMIGQKQNDNVKWKVMPRFNHNGFACFYIRNLEIPHINLHKKEDRFAHFIFRSEMECCM